MVLSHTGPFWVDAVNTHSDKKKKNYSLLVCIVVVCVCVLVFFKVPRTAESDYHVVVVV